MDEIHRLNAEVVAIASRNKSDVKKTQSTLNISYVLVPGPIPALMKQYGVYNEQNGLAVPATMIIDKAGILRWRYVGSNDSDRPNAAKIISELRKLK